MTTEIHRLDYSRPPPGYEINSQWFNDGDSPDAAGVGGCLPNEYWQQWQWVLESEDHCGDWFGEGDEEAKTDGPAAAMADAWADYKTHNAPPGMRSDSYGYGQDAVAQTWWVMHNLEADADAARAAAWAWYDRRLALLAKLELAEVVTRQFIADDFWPAIVSWSDEQVADAERWLVDNAMELPEVLGGSAPGEEDADVCDESGHVCTGCIGDGPCVALEAEIKAEERDADEIAELEAEIDDDDEFMDDGLCSPTPQSELPSNAEGPLSRSRWAMSLSWDDLLRQHRDRSPLVARAVELAALRDAHNVICDALETEEAIEAEIRRRLACDEVPTELETRIAQWRADNPPPTPEQMASIKADIRDLARRRKARLLAERDQQSEPTNPTGRDRQVAEHNATTLPLLDFSAPPPGYEVDCYPHEKASDPPTSFGVALTGARPLCRFADEGEAVAAAWSDYKLSRDPPGMWCGFSRSVDDLDNCSIRVGVHACGARWELQPDITVPYEGFTVRARAWAWAWYERRHALMVKICKVVADQRQLDRGAYHIAVSLILTDRAPFHRVLCWHNEWVDEVEAWIEKPSSTVPEALR